MGVLYARHGSVFTITCEGTYAADDMIRVFDAIVSDDGLPRNALLLLDMSRSQAVLERPVAEMRRVASHFVRHAHRFQHRLAIVADAGARYGLMRMASVWVEFEGSTVHVFLDHDEAVRWLVSNQAASA